MLPAMFPLVYVGATARAALEVQPTTAADFYQQILKYVGLAATVLMVVIVTRLARKALREAERAQVDSAITGKARFAETYEPTPFDKMLAVDDAHDKQFLENCRPPRWVNPTPPKKYNLVVIGAGTAGLGSAAGASGTWGENCAHCC